MNATIHKLAYVALMAGCTSEFNPDLGNVEDSDSAGGGDGSVGGETNEPTDATSEGGGSDGGESGSDGSGDGSTEPADPCGNGILEDDEECDSTEGCKEDCELEFYECNPLTQTRCPDGHICAYDERFPDLNCIYQTGNGGQGTECEDYGNCAPGYACIDASFIESCAGYYSICCARWCDLNNDTCPSGYYCRKWFINGDFDPGMDHLGNCVSP